jgi:hypothetical protein
LAPILYAASVGSNDRFFHAANTTSRSPLMPTAIIAGAELAELAGKMLSLETLTTPMLGGIDANPRAPPALP